MANITLIILAIIFLPTGGIFLYQGIGYSLVGNILGATISIFFGLVFLFLGGLIVTNVLRKRK